jgi:hypothetical protein
VLTFAAGGYRLETGCGNYAGDATVHKATVDFANQHDLGGNYCLNPLGRQLAQFLDGTADWTIDKGQLKLTKGATTTVFNPAGN